MLATANCLLGIKLSKLEAEIDIKNRLVSFSYRSGTYFLNWVLIGPLSFLGVFDFRLDLEKYFLKFDFCWKKLGLPIYDAILKL